MSTPVTLTGRLGGPPELRFSQNGKAVASFSVVTERRQYNKQTSEWESASTTWWRCTAFGDLAENLCESFTDKGTALIVVGRVEEETWNDKQSGAKRSAMKVIVEEVGPSLKYATAKVSKAERTGGSGGGGQSQGGRPQNQQQSGSGSGWGGNGGSAQGGWGSGPSGSEPPF